MNPESTAPAGQPLDLAYVKRSAKTLAAWTTLTLAECQEITASAFGATSWQALLAMTTFVPHQQLRFGHTVRRS